MIYTSEGMEYLRRYRARTARQNRIKAALHTIDRQVVISTNLITGEIVTRSREFNTSIPKAFTAMLPETY